MYDCVIIFCCFIMLLSACRKQLLLLVKIHGMFFRQNMHIVSVQEECLCEMKDRGHRDTVVRQRFGYFVLLHLVCSREYTRVPLESV